MQSETPTGYTTDFRVYERDGEDAYIARSLDEVYAYIKELTDCDRDEAGEYREVDPDDEVTIGYDSEEPGAVPSGEPYGNPHPWLVTKTAREWAASAEHVDLLWTIYA